MMGIAERPPAAPERLRTEPGADSARSNGDELSRRHLLRAAALAGAGVPLLAACSSSSSGARTDSKTTAASGAGGSATSGAKTKTKGADAPSTGGSGASPALATTGEVPKGGGIILPDAGVVITQPRAGTFEGFSSTCTHMGCTLDNVSNGTINCICHGSQFSIKNGDVVTGPATVPLPAKPLVVTGKDISLK